MTLSGWNFDNSYHSLPSILYTPTAPVPVSSPSLVVFNHELAQALGLNTTGLPDQELANIFSGNILPRGAVPIAQAYAGHQFGHFTMLGDGRAHLLGEQITPGGDRFDMQLKGSGQTAYSRRGDGRAALAPMLREYLISEAMAALDIPTTRSLAVVKTGEPVERETILDGAVLTRIAASHMRVGTFEYCAARQDRDALKKLLNYAIERHDPEITNSTSPALDFLKRCMDRQARLITHWMRVGFVHGVMNTDNMTISGETIDYGPCAFLDAYDPEAVFSSIDHYGRYAFNQQARIAQWNLARLAEALLPLIDDDIESAVKIAEETIESFESVFQNNWLEMMRAKIGLFNTEPEDAVLVDDLLSWMHKNKADYTNTFRSLSSDDTGLSISSNPQFLAWHARWKTRLLRNSKPLKSSLCLMRNTNPAVIPRNHIVEEVLTAATQSNDLGPLQKLLEVLRAPYDEPAASCYTLPAPMDAPRYRTFCGT